LLDKKHLQTCKLWKVTRAKSRGIKNFIIESNQVAVIDLETSTDLFDNYLYKYLYDELWNEDNEYKYDD